MTTLEPENAILTDFDHRDEESAARPWDRWARLRAADSIAYSDKYGGFYIAAEYQDVCAIARDTSAFSSHPYTTLLDLKSPPMPPINFDPPVNRAYREIINPFFSPTKVQEYLPWIKEIADKWVQPLLKQDAYEFHADLGIPVTRAVIFRIMGIEKPPGQVNRWSDDLIQGRPTAEEAGASLMAFLAEELAKRRESPGSDFMTGLAQGTFQGRPLTDEEILSTSILVLLAGLETTGDAMTGAIWHLVTKPELTRQLAADVTVWRTATDEFVRWTSPAAMNTRNVRGDTEVHGCPMRERDKVMILWGSANRDEAQFPNADDIVLDRTPNRHVGFGMGPHRCVGSHLAKVVMQTVLERLVPTLPEWELLDPAAVRWEGSEVRGIRRLDLVRKSARK